MLNFINGISEFCSAPIDSIFNVYVGLVSGRDKIYRVPFGNTDILNDKDKVEKYIFMFEEKKKDVILLTILHRKQVIFFCLFIFFLFYFQSI